MAIYKRGGVWWVDVYAGNPPKRVRKSTKTADEQAARIVEQTIVGVNRGTTSRQQAVAIIDALMPKEHTGIRLDGLVAYYESCIADEKIVISKRTLRQRLNIAGAFAAWTKDETNAITADDVTNETAYAYSKELGKRGILGKSLNSYVGDLSTVWKMLMKRGKVKDNPWTLARVQRDRENEHTGRAFTADEIERLLKVSRKVGHDWYGVTMVSLYTGLRMPDCINLKWTGDPDREIIVDMKAKRIYGTPTKTRRSAIRVNVPMHDKLYNCLIQLKRDGEWVFPWRHDHPASLKIRGTDKGYPEILKLAKIEPISKSDKISFHCLRHTFISRLAEAGVAEDVRMRLAGHTNADTHSIYTHDDVSGRRAIELLR